MMLRRTVLKILGAVIAAPVIGWPIRKVAPRRWNLWIGRVSDDWNDRRNWLLNEVPISGDSVMFNSYSGHLTENLTQNDMNLSIDRLLITDDFKGTIGKQGRPV